MFKVRESKNFKRVVLHETEQTRIEYVKDKRNSSMDKIRFVKLGSVSMNTNPQIICIWRYEDEEIINNMLSLYGYKEEV